MGKMREKTATLFTIGHSTRSIDEFVEMLQARGVKLVIDVRTIPKSKHNPQYNGDALARSLTGCDIEYEHMPGLGGLRHPGKDSPNMAWENASFRGFADYMQTEDFKKSLSKLIERAKNRSTAIMCAEAVPWRCHRSLIGDALLVHGVSVMEIINKNSAREHSLTSWAKVDGETITYPAENDQSTTRIKK